MLKARLVAAGLLALAFAAVWAQAGTVIVFERWAYDPYSDSGSFTAYVGENKARVEIKGKDNTAQVIFDVEKQDAPIMWVVTPADQSYIKMDSKTLKKLQDKMQEMYEMLKGYTATLSPDEKAEIEKQYKKQLRQADYVMTYEERTKKTMYQKVAGGEKVNAWTCDHYKGMFNKELDTEVWVAGWKDVGLEPKDLAALVAIGQIFKGFGADLVPFMGQKVEGANATIDGVPVKTIHYEAGNKTVRDEVKEIRKEELDPKLFVVPEGYTEKPALPQ